MVRVIVLFCVALSASGCSTGRQAGSCDGPCPASKINHLIVVVQENHTFDNYFGRYCTAATASNPTCTAGPACCEAGPTTEPGGAGPQVLDDDANGAYSPNHDASCESLELNGGAMDHFVTGAGVASCSDVRNFAYAAPSLVKPYWDLAAGGALADRYFQPLVGASAANDMYLARASFVFGDNGVVPDAAGVDCSFIPTKGQFTDRTIGDLLADAGVSWAWYGEGYADALAAHKMSRCGDPPDACPAALGFYPCVYDPSDVPFQYFPRFTDNPTYMRDLATMVTDLSSGKLPQLSFVKGLGFHSEHPALKTRISDGVAFVSSVVERVRASAYASDTLVLITYDEGGGYFDHIAPPANGVDGKPLGTRVPMIAVGPMTRVGAVSHVTMEHSSIVKFVEWNWLKQVTGQLGTRDAVVNNLGSLLDASKTGIAVPE